MEVGVVPRVGTKTNQILIHSGIAYMMSSLTSLRALHMIIADNYKQGRYSQPQIHQGPTPCFFLKDGTKKMDEILKN